MKRTIVAHYSFYFIWKLLNIAPAANFGKEVREARPIVSQAIKRYIKEQQNKKQDPSQLDYLEAVLINNTEIGPETENYLLKEERKTSLHQYPAIHTSAIDDLTNQVNKILQAVETSPNVYELEGMYALHKAIENSLDCTRENIGVTENARNFTYDTTAISLLATSATSLKSIQVIKYGDKKEHVYYYRGVLDTKHIIIQVSVQDNIDDAKFKIYSLKSLQKHQSEKEKKQKQSVAITPTKDIKQWGALYGKEYKNGDFSIKGGAGFKYKYDSSNMPQNITIWQLDSEYKSENFNWDLESELDTKKQEIRARLSPKNNKNNAIELFLKGANPGIIIKNQLSLGTYSLKGKTQYYKKIFSGKYKFNEERNLFSFNTDFSIDQDTGEEHYVISKNLYKKSSVNSEEILNLRFENESGEGRDNESSVWLTFFKKF